MSSADATTRAAERAVCGRCFADAGAARQAVEFALPMIEAAAHGERRRTAARFARRTFDQGRAFFSMTHSSPFASSTMKRMSCRSQSARRRASFTSASDTR